MGDHNRSRSPIASLASVGAAAMLVVCCAAGPALFALVGGIGVAALLGAGAGVIAVGAVSAVTIVAVRARRRRAADRTRLSHRR